MPKVQRLLQALTWFRIDPNFGHMETVSDKASARVVPCSR